jgi:murein DD-endopeptidase MepM/ murein hydrolase activator NlpD
MLTKFTLCVLVCLTSVTLSYAGEIFKYKDAQGHWVFSENPPKTELPYKKTTYQKKVNAGVNPQYYTTQYNNSYQLMLTNPFYAPIEVEFISPMTNKMVHRVIQANSSGKLFESIDKPSAMKYKWIFGDPNKSAIHYGYSSPFKAPMSNTITQGFNGSFSHKTEGSKFSIDIAMDVGTYLTAARSGTVVAVKDDYHMSGKTTYFLDKANSITVLHDDGSFALYAHILIDTATVSVGSKVSVGDVIARSGSSGFSTGPHLHFSVYKNTGFKLKSIPFKFIDQAGNMYVPKRGMTMYGAS